MRKRKGETPPLCVGSTGIGTEGVAGTALPNIQGSRQPKIGKVCKCAERGKKKKPQETEKREGKLGKMEGARKTCAISGRQQCLQLVDGVYL